MIGVKHRKQGQWIETNIPEEGAKGLIQDHLQATKNSHLTLSQVGIDRNDSPLVWVGLGELIKREQEAGRLATSIKHPGNSWVTTMLPTI